MAAPGGTGPIGPFPPHVEGDEAQDEYDKLRRRVLWSLPYGLYVVGQPGRRPPQPHDPELGHAGELRAQAGRHRGREDGAHPRAGRATGGSFTLNTVSREDRAIVRKFTKPVEDDPAAGTLNGFPVHDGPTGAPILDPGRRLDRLPRSARPSTAGATRFFVGEVVDCAFPQAEDTPVLRMEDTRMSYGG